VIIVLLVICNIFILFLGDLSARLFAKFAALPKSWISTAIICFSLTGSFALNSSAVDVLVCLIAGVLGFFFYKAEFPTGPMVLALILGKMVESNLSRSLLLSKGSYAIFVNRPVSLALFVLTMAALFVPEILKWKKHSKQGVSK
jgi:putative tricarboxylic transport membrane protein